MTAPAVSRLVQVTRNQGQPIAQFITGATWVDQVALSSTAASYTVPTGATLLRVTPLAGAGATFGNFNGAAVVPAAGKTDGSGSFPIPATGLCVVAPSGGGTLSMISATSSYATIEVWN